MKKAMIKLAYRQVIDILSGTDFEQKVFNDSYAEFLVKIQSYNPGRNFTKFSEIVANDGKANSLHYKTGFAVLHHIETLNGRIPGLQDSAGRMHIPFAIPEFKLIESDITNKSLHKVSVTYITDPIILLDSFGEHLLLVLDDQSQQTDELETFILAMQPNLSISSYKEIDSRISSILRPANSL